MSAFLFLAPTAIGGRPWNDRAMLRDRWSAVFAVALAVCGAAAGCNDDPRKPQGHAVVAARPPRPPAVALRKVDWANVSLPGAVCAASRPIHLHHHTAFLKEVPRRWAHLLSSQREQGLRRGVRVDAGWEPVSYGTLGDGGPDAAALVVSCNNGGGTADGALAYAWVIFTGHPRNLDVAGIVTPQGPQSPHELPSTITLAFKDGGIKAREYWYGHRDGTCCPSGRATTIWTYAAAQLRPSPAVTTRQPR
jgi:hypothetical protein